MIKLDWVLTARHCLGDTWRRIHFTPNAQTVLAGFSNSSDYKNGQNREVAVDSIILLDSTGMFKDVIDNFRYSFTKYNIDFHLYESHNFSEKVVDLALLRIDPPFEETDTVKPIQINDIYENLVGQEILISGWGMTTTGYPGQLQKLC